MSTSNESYTCTSCFYGRCSPQPVEPLCICCVTHGAFDEELDEAEKTAD